MRCPVLALTVGEWTGASAAFPSSRFPTRLSFLGSLVNSGPLVRAPHVPRLVVNALVGLFFGVTLYYVALVYTASCAVVFMARTLANLVPENDASGRAGEHRNHLLAGYVAPS